MTHGALAGIVAGSIGLILTVASVPARADRIHLRSGGVIETGSWWDEGDTLMYRNAEGTVGIPRSFVVRIERTDGSQAVAMDADSSEPDESPDDAHRSAETFKLTPGLVQQITDANTALEQRDFETASSLYQAVMLETESSFHVARVGYALSQMALGEDAVALSVVQEALAWTPAQPSLLELLGDLRNREEKVDAALRAWREANRHAPLDRIAEKIAKAERELQAGRRYDLATSTHFNLRFDGEGDSGLSHAVIEFLEEQYWTLAQKLDHTPRQPITVILYPTREFRDVTQTPEWVGGTYDGKIRVPLGGLERLDPRATAVLTHELTHAFVHSKTRGHCPRWLHEGLAQVFEGRTLSRADRQRVVKRLRESGPSRWESAGFSYPAALSLVRHLEGRRGFHRLVDLLDRLAGGQTLEAALIDVYGAGYDSLCRDWGEQLLAEDQR